MSSKLTLGDNACCLTTPRGPNQRMGRRRGWSTHRQPPGRPQIIRDDYDEMRLTAAVDCFAVEHLARHMEKDAQNKGLGSLPNGNSLATGLDRGWIGPLSVRPEPGLIS